MDIIPLGLSSFRIKGKSGTVVTDPFQSEMVGLKFPKNTTADIVTVSHDHPDHNQLQLVGSEVDKQIVVRGPGEYEIKGIEITGIPTFHDTKGGLERGQNTVYKFEIDKISLVHLGDLGHKLSEDQVELLDGIDILLIPVGGTYTIDAHTASQIVAELEPKIIIPMHYLRPQLNQKIFGSLTPVNLFLKEMGKENIPVTGKLKVTKDSLPLETEIVILEPA